MTVVAVVEIPTDDRGSSADFAKALEATAAYYLSVPGLVRKHYLWGEDGIRGGIYVWRTRADAEGFFGPEWRARIKERYWAEPKVTLFDSPVTVECGGVIVAAERRESPSPQPSPPLGGGEGATRARRLRRDATEVEKRLWQRLRDHQLDGHKFRRQHPIGPYVADFACAEIMVAIELDGGQHGADGPRRTRFIESKGWRILRFWNNEVTDNLDGVLEHIRHTARTPSRPCNGGEGGGEGGRGQRPRRTAPAARKEAQSCS